jgi:hypothetical protein
VSFQAQIFDWFAIRGFGSSLVYLPSDRNSAVAFGTTAQAQFGAGAQASLPFGDSFRAAAMLDFSYGPASTVTPIVPLVRSARSGTFDTSGLYTTSNAVFVEPGVSAALALSPLFGVLGSLQAVLPTAPTAGTGIDHHALAFAAVLDFNISTVTSLPFSVTGGYRIVAPFEGDTTLFHQFDVAVLYAGRREFVTGVELGFRWFPLNQIDDTFAALVNLVLRYYW